MRWLTAHLLYADAFLRSSIEFLVFIDNQLYGLRNMGFYPSYLSKKSNAYSSLSSSVKFFII